MGYTAGVAVMTAHHNRKARSSARERDHSSDPYRLPDPEQPASTARKRRAKPYPYEGADLRAPDIKEGDVLVPLRKAKLALSVIEGIRGFVLFGAFFAFYFMHTAQVQPRGRPPRLPARRAAARLWTSAERALRVAAPCSPTAHPWPLRPPMPASCRAPAAALQHEPRQPLCRVVPRVAPLLLRPGRGRRERLVPVAAEQLLVLRALRGARLGARGRAISG